MKIRPVSPATTASPTRIARLWSAAIDDLRDLAYFSDSLISARRRPHAPAKSISDPGVGWLALLLICNLADVVDALTTALPPARNQARPALPSSQTVQQAREQNELAGIHRQAVALRSVVIASLERSGAEHSRRQHTEQFEIPAGGLLTWLAVTLDRLASLVARERRRAPHPRPRATASVPSAVAPAEATVRRPARRDPRSSPSPAGAAPPEMAHLLRRIRRLLRAQDAVRRPAP
jgi:hypothetical protein